MTPRESDKEQNVFDDEAGRASAISLVALVLPCRPGTPWPSWTNDLVVLSSGPFKTARVFALEAEVGVRMEAGCFDELPTGVWILLCRVVPRVTMPHTQSVRLAWYVATA